MEFLLDLVGDNLPIQALCILVLLIITLKDIKLHQNLKVGVLYIASFVMILLGLVDILLGVGILLLAEFVLLEVFTEDVEKRTLFGIKYKVIDCLYKLFVEYYFILYFGSIVVLTTGELVVRNCNTLLVQGEMPSWLCEQQSTFAAWIVLSAAFLILVAVLCITRMEFETKSITGIMKALRSVSIYSVPIEDMRTKLGMLVAFEDKTFLNRHKDSHTVLSPLVVRGAFKYINKDTLKRPIRTMRKIFSRGYGTIEMQLIRNVGVERGFDTCVLRRKMFEAVYATIIFNSYRKQFTKDSDSAQNYKYWMLWCYMQKVPVKFSRRFFPTTSSTAQQVFGKKFEDLSLEEFFVWCLGLEFFALIGPKTVMKRESIIVGYELDWAKIEAAIQFAYNAK